MKRFALSTDKSYSGFAFGWFTRKWTRSWFETHFVQQYHRLRKGATGKGANLSIKTSRLNVRLWRKTAARIVEKRPSQCAALKPHLARGEVVHDFFRTAADRHHAHFAIDAFGAAAADKSGAAENLHRFAGAEFHCPRGLYFQKR